MPPGIERPQPQAGDHSLRDRSGRRRSMTVSPDCHATRNPPSATHRLEIYCAAQIWQHNYEPDAGSLGVSALVAAIPIAVLFLMLGFLRKPAWMSSLAALASALVVSLAVYGMPLKLALLSTIYGAAYGLFPIAWVVFASIMLYRLAVDTGKFEVIKDSVGTLTDDRRLQALFIAFSFGAFIEGAAGFGAPVAVSGAMLAGLGFNPFYAA